MDDLVTVSPIDGKGRGIFAEREFSRGENIFVDYPTVVCQYYHNRIQEIPVCDNCLRSLETLESQTKRILEMDTLIPLPFHRECSPSYAINEIFYCVGGCNSVKFCSKRCAWTAWETYHQCLCYALNEGSEDDPNHPLTELMLPTEPYAAGEMDHSDLFILVIKMIAMIIQAFRSGTPNAIELFDGFCVHPWFDIPFGGGSTDPKTFREQKVQLVDRLQRSLKNVKSLYDEKLDTVFSVDFITKLLGLASSNCQERTPVPPLVQYLENLKSMPDADTREFLQMVQFLELRERVMIEAKGEGLFPLHCCLNHSCDPNCVIVNSMDVPNSIVVAQALKPISKGEEITISYIDEAMSKEDRQQILKNHYMFDCNCRKCISEPI